MQPNQHRRRCALAAVVTVVVLAGCGSDGLVPDGTVENDTDQPPATDTRTTDAPTASNLMTTEP